jgi:hypothetical protein
MIGGEKGLSIIVLKPLMLVVVEAGLEPTLIQYW